MLVATDGRFSTPMHSAQLDVVVRNDAAPYDAGTSEGDAFFA